MVRKSFMLIAGEASGDLLASELVPILRENLSWIEGAPSDDRQPLHASLQAEFYGAGGPQMAKAGVKLAFDLTEHAVVGFWEVLRRYRQFRRLFYQLLELAIEREPDAIVCVDFSGFNLRFGSAVRRHVRSLQGTFGNWNPQIIQYVSPQVWGSRPGRAQRLARDFDLLLSIFPFEPEWYAQRTPDLRVEFVGHPLIDRYARAANAAGIDKATARVADSQSRGGNVLLLPGSRVGELRHHLPIMLESMKQVRAAQPGLCWSLVLPNDSLVQLARTYRLPKELHVQVGGIERALQGADLAIASTGTVTLECAYFGVPTVALYRTSPGTYWIAKRLAQVKFLAMPNLLLGKEVFPEFIQDAATAANVSQAILDLLNDREGRRAVKSKLAKVIESLGPPGASRRAANAILRQLQMHPRPLRTSLSR